MHAQLGTVWWTWARSFPEYLCVQSTWCVSSSPCVQRGGWSHTTRKLLSHHKGITRLNVDGMRTHFFLLLQTTKNHQNILLIFFSFLNDPFAFRCPCPPTLPPPPLPYDAINFYTADNFAEARFKNNKVCHCGRPGATRLGGDHQRWSFSLEGAGYSACGGAHC